jgi:hypothetical protein
MVLAGKVFLVREESSLEELAAKVKGFRTEEEYEEGDRSFSLATEVRELSFSAESLRGVFSWDQVLNIYYREGVFPTPRTFEAAFSFTINDKRILLTILEKKNRANNIANQLSKILFITTGRIVEGRILPEVLKRFHNENSDDTKIVFFDDVDVPNVGKLSLYGSELGNTSLYDEYLSHGKLWYVVVKSRKYGYIVGVTRDCVVTIFSKVRREEFVDYIVGEIFPLIA